MALVSCVDCGKQISDKSKQCVQCGCPLSVENVDCDTSFTNDSIVFEIPYLEIWDPDQKDWIQGKAEICHNKVTLRKFPIRNNIVYADELSGELIEIVFDNNSTVSTKIDATYPDVFYLDDHKFRVGFIGKDDQWKKNGKGYAKCAVSFVNERNKALQYESADTKILDWSNIVTCPKCGGVIPSAESCIYCNSKLADMLQENANATGLTIKGNVKPDFVGAIIILAVILGFIFMLSQCGGSGSNDPKSDAWVCAKNVVESNLKSPSSAKFCSYSQATITQMGDNRYKIKGTVDAENSFGATIRNNFVVTLTLTTSGYKDASCTID